MSTIKNSRQVILKMASSTFQPTTGRAELDFLRAALDCTSTINSRSNSSSSSESPNIDIQSVLSGGVHCNPSSELPGTNGSPPDWFDLDGYSMLISQPNFLRYIPKIFNVLIGGRTIPNSSKVMRKNHKFRYFGTANGNLHLHIPEIYYMDVMSHLRAAVPAPVGSEAAARSNQKSYRMEEVAAALNEGGNTWLILSCYGLEDRLIVSPDGEVELNESQLFLRDLADSSAGLRIDVAATWLAGGDTYYVSFPGSPGGIRLFEIGAPLQSLTSLLRHMKPEPHSTERAASFKGDGGWRGGTATAAASFLQRKTKGALFRICPGPPGTPAFLRRVPQVLSV